MHEVSLCCVTISITYHNSNSMYLFYMFIESVMYGVRKVIKIQSKAPFLTKLEWHIKLKGDQIVFGAREMDHFNKKGSRYKKQVLTQVIFLFAVGRCEDCHTLQYAANNTGVCRDVVRIWSCTPVGGLNKIHNMHNAKELKCYFPNFFLR